MGWLASLPGPKAEGACQVPLGKCVQPMRSRARGAQRRLRTSRRAEWGWSRSGRSHARPERGHVQGCVPRARPTGRCVSASRVCESSIHAVTCEMRAELCHTVPIHACGQSITSHYLQQKIRFRRLSRYASRVAPAARRRRPPPRGCAVCGDLTSVGQSVRTVCGLGGRCAPCPEPPTRREREN